MNGYFSLLLVTMIYGAYGIFIRFIGQEFSVFSQSWIRSLLVAIICLLLIAFTKTRLKVFLQKDLKWIFLWLLSGVGTIPLTFTAFNNLPIGTTYFLIYVTMIASGYISGIFLFKEKLTIAKLLSMVLALIGLVVIYSIDFNPEKTIYIYLALLSGCLTGFWNTVTKKFSENYPGLQLVLTDSLTAFIISLVAFFITKESLPSLVLSPAWGWVGIYSLAQICTVSLVIYGFKNIEAQVGSLIMPLETLFGAIFGLIIFQEALSVILITGGILIFIASIIPSLSLFDKKLLKQKS